MHRENFLHHSNPDIKLRRSKEKKWSITKAIFGKNETKYELSEEHAENNEEKVESDSDDDLELVIGSRKNKLQIKEPPSPSPLLEKSRPRSLSAGSQFIRSIIQSTAEELPEARKRPQFGLTPVELFQRYPEAKVPLIVEACVELLKNDLSKEGLFRIPGRLTKILEMKIAFEQGGNLVGEEEEIDVHAIAGLLAQFFRELPEPLLTYGLYPRWIAVAKLDDLETENEQIQELTKELPAPNYELLKYFIEFLVQVAKYSGANRMGSRNLALVFGASLLNPVVMDQLDLESIKSQCKVIERLIDNYTVIFEGTGSICDTKHIRAVSTIPAGMTASPISIAERKKKELKSKKRHSLTLQASSFKGNHRLLNPFLNNDLGKSPISSPSREGASDYGSDGDDKKLKKEKKLKEKKEKKDKKEKKKKNVSEEINIEEGEDHNQSEVSSSTDSTS